jgi:hypothetical protein
VQRTEGCARADGGLGRARPFHRLLEVEVDESVQARVALLDAGDGRRHQLDRGQFAAADTPS